MLASTIRPSVAFQVFMTSRFIAITDRGSWLRGRLVYHNDKPAGIAEAEIAPNLDPMASCWSRTAGTTS